MAEKSDQDQVISLQDALKMEMIINQALIDLLVKKGLISHDELMEMVKEVKIKQGIVLSGDASKKASH